LKIGIPDLAVYCFSHLFNETLEKIFTFFPSFIFVAQISAPGVESTMSSLGGTIISMNMFVLRGIIGLACNKIFFNITRETIVDFYKLMGIQVIGTFIPLLYMYKMIPSSAEIRATQQKHLAKIEEGQEAVKQIKLESRGEGVLEEDPEKN